MKVINAILNDAQAFLKEELTKSGLLSIVQIENIIKEGYNPEKDNWLFKDDDLQRLVWYRQLLAQLTILDNPRILVDKIVKR